MVLTWEWCEEVPWCGHQRQEEVNVALGFLFENVREWWELEGSQTWKFRQEVEVQGVLNKDINHPIDLNVIWNTYIRAVDVDVTCITGNNMGNLLNDCEEGVKDLIQFGEVINRLVLQFLKKWIQYKNQYQHMFVLQTFSRYWSMAVRKTFTSCKLAGKIS